MKTPDDVVRAPHSCRLNNTEHTSSCVSTFYRYFSAFTNAEHIIARKRKPIFDLT